MTGSSSFLQYELVFIGNCKMDFLEIAKREFSVIAKIKSHAAIPKIPYPLVVETIGEEKLEMLNMTQINDIRKLYFEEGLNYAQISRATSFDVNTIKKYIWQKNFNQPQPKARKARVSKLDPFKEDSDTWLEEDKLGRRKQRHTAKRVIRST